MKPKYKVGDILYHYYWDNNESTGTFVVDEIREDNGMILYIHYDNEEHTCISGLYENDVIRVLNHDSEEYKEYQEYLGLKKKFG